MLQEKKLSQQSIANQTKRQKKKAPINDLKDFTSSSELPLYVIVLGHSKTRMFIDRSLHQKSLMLSDQHFVSSSLTCILSSFFFVSSLNSYLYHCFYTLLHFTRTSACYSSQHTPLLLSHFLLKMVGFVCPPFSLETIDVAMCFKNSTLFSFIYYFSFWDAKELSTTKEWI